MLSSAAWCKHVRFSCRRSVGCSDFAFYCENTVLHVMSAKKNKSKTVSDKITEAFLPKAEEDPENDPENLVKIADFNGEDEEVDFDFDSKPSEIRKRNIKLLSEFSDKYKGKVASRKELEASSEEGGSNSEEGLNSDLSDNDDSEIETYRDELNGIGKDERNSDNSDADDSGDDYQTSDDSEREGSKTNGGFEDSNAFSDSVEGESGDEDSDSVSSFDDEGDQEEDQTQLLTESNQNAEIQKGFAVQNQLKIWEKLLEIRIHSQKILTRANSLPPPVVYDKLCDQNDFSSLASTTIANVENLLENMLEMQSLLSSQFSETKDIFKENKKRSSTGKLVEPPLKRFARTLTANFDLFTPYRNSVLQKWDDRTRILAPGAGGKKGGKSLNDNFDILRKVEAVLLNKSDLLAKSQTVKGNYRLFGSQENGDTTENGKENLENGQSEEEKLIQSAEVYDDTDFYHQQLRELIEYKSNTSANPAEMSKQFAELQKLRQKMKKKVDTRASKGRKIRYHTTQFV